LLFLLGQKCQEIRELKTASVSGRKRLNDITKNFRNRPKEEQLGQITEVLKAYQEEIDQLSRRSKFSEACFHGLYKSVYDAPDPALAIESLVVQLTATSTHILEIKRLKAELSQYEEEFQQLKNQDITIRHLENQIEEYREKFAEKLEQELAVHVANADERAELKVQEVLDNQHILERRLNEAVDAMRQARSSAERAQASLYEVSSQAELRISTLTTENSMLAEAIERSQNRIIELERDLECARTSSATNGNGIISASATAMNGTISNPYDEIQTLQAMLLEIRQEYRQKEEVARSEKSALEAQIRDLTQLLSSERTIVAKLQSDLAERPTKEEYATVRRQLGLLQRVTFNIQEEDCEVCVYMCVHESKDDSTRLRGHHTIHILSFIYLQ